MNDSKMHQPALAAKAGTAVVDFRVMLKGILA
jgi:hypothetical protein